MFLRNITPETEKLWWPPACPCGGSCFVRAGEF